MQPRVMIISRHDYRTGWRANMHFLADAYFELGYQVKFMSVGYSVLSLLASDHRKNLFSASNQWQELNGVKCYLWRSLIHPFGRGLGRFKNTTDILFRKWINSSCPQLDETSRTSDLIIVESGISAALIGRIRAASPDAKIVYLVSDLLETIGAHPFVADQLYRDRTAIDAIVVVARAMAPSFKNFDCPVYFIPHGISKQEFETIGASPFKAKQNVVTVGSMLFDEDVFVKAAAAFPEVDFHLIGTPKIARTAENIIHHDRMPFRETLPFVKHASAGVAPYRNSENAEYLSDSSMKLMQYDYLKIPAVCPFFAVGDNQNRYGYQPGSPVSIVTAMQAALDAEYVSTVAEPFDWLQVAEHMANPGQSLSPL